MKDKSELPIVVTETERQNPYIMSGIAQTAFQLANYDMTPDKNPVDIAIERRLITVEKPAVNSDEDVQQRIEVLPN